MIKASFDAWMNAEYWVGGPKGVDFSTRYTSTQLKLMKDAFVLGSDDLSLGKVFFGTVLDENDQYLVNWSYGMGVLFTKRLQDAEQTNT